jgi:hypothetical protein
VVDVVVGIEWFDRGEAEHVLEDDEGSEGAHVGPSGEVARGVGIGPGYLIEELAEVHRRVVNELDETVVIGEGVVFADKDGEQLELLGCGTDKRGADELQQFGRRKLAGGRGVRERLEGGDGFIDQHGQDRFFAGEVSVKQGIVDVGGLRQLAGGRVA